MAKTLLGIASGAESEAVKLAAVKDALDRAGVPAKAEIAIELKPWEQLMSDIAGIATVPRRGQPALVEPGIIDAEVIPETGSEPRELRPPENRPRRAEDERTPAVAPVDPEPYSASRSGPRNDQPETGLMTLEEALTETTKTRVRRVTKRYQ